MTIILAMTNTLPLKQKPRNPDLSSPRYASRLSSGLALLFMAYVAPGWADDLQGSVDEITVKAKSTHSKADAYYQKDAGAATRTNTPAMETSQAVNILSRQVLDDIHATRLDDTLELVSGVSRQNNFGGLWDNFAIRGFAGHDNTGPAMLRNGFSGNRGFNPPRDTANTERVEFLKGPAAALYGNSEPGGTLNVVTKKPQFKASNSAEVYAGSYDTYRSVIDSTGPLSENLAYRLIVAAEDKGSFRDHVDSERLLLSPSLTWLISPSTTLNYELEYLKHRTPLDRGIALRDSNGRRLHHIHRNRFLGDPEAGDITMEAFTHQLSLEHEFSQRWRGRLGVAYKLNRTDGDALETRPGFSFISPAGDVRRRLRQRDLDSNDLNLLAELNGQFDTAGLQHDLLIGMEAYRFENQQWLGNNNGVGNALSINQYSPRYHIALPSSFTVASNFREQQTNIALFLQDQLSLDEHWKLMAGVRLESYRQELHNRLNNSITRQDHSVLSPRLGLTYVVNPTLSLYTSFSRSFRPNAGTAGGNQFGLDASGDAFDPERGRAWESGIKYQAPDQRLGATLAVFDITKTNVLTNNPSQPDFSIAAGEVRSRGIEFDLSGQLTERIRLIGSYTFTDAYLGKDLKISPIPGLLPDGIVAAGSRLSNIPRHSASAMLMHEQPLAGGGKLGVGGGFSYVGKRADSSEDLFELPSYVTVRLMSYWQMNPKLRLSLDVSNLFDREYYASSYNSSWIMPGTPRMITLGLQAKF